MRRTAALLVATTTVALTASVAASAYAPATGHRVAATPERAIVEVETPRLPGGEGASAERRRSRLRAVSDSLLDRVAERNGLDAVGRIPETGQLMVALEGESVGELARRLSADPRVERVEADRLVELRYAPSDIAFNAADPNAPGGDFAQWNLRRAGAPAAWDLSKGAGAEVAVIDTGAAATHPDLGPRISLALDCDVPSAPTASLCGGTDVSDGVGHGTHVAGMACGATDNGFGIASMGFGCNLVIAKVSLCSAVAEAIVFAANRSSDAINISLGSCGSGLIGPIDYAWARESVPVVAAANCPVPNGSSSSCPAAGANYPAQRVQPEGTGPTLDLGKGLVVTAAKYDGTRAAFAQQTTGVSVAAYGAASDAGSCGQQGILSTWPSGSTTFDTSCGSRPVRTSVGGDNRFAYLVGTSMATPQVAGLVALMRAAKPDLPAAKLVRLVKLTASNCGQYRDGIGWGRIDAPAALAAALDRDIDPPGSNLRRSGAGRLRLKRFDKADCSDELPSSGVKVVSVFASRNGGKYRRIAKTKKKTVRFRPKRGGRYRFYSIATDEAGNREAPPPEPDERIRVKL